MNRKAVIIIGSPRKNSNTHILAEEARRGLEDSGVDSEVIFLNDLNIKGCQACNGCRASPEAGCAVKDDMQKVYQAMEASDGIIVATPIYFSDVTAQTKLWMDRLFRYFGAGKSIPGHKKAAFIFTQNQPDEKRYLNAADTFESMVGLVGFEPRGRLVAADLMKGVKPMVTENPRAMRAAYELGKNLLGDGA